MDVDTPLHIVTVDPHTLALSIRASCLVFEDPASKALLERVQRIAPSEATTLIIGETGTGRSGSRAALAPLNESTLYVRVGPKGGPESQQLAG